MKKVRAAVEKQNENKAFNERTRPRQFYRQILSSFEADNSVTM